ncbi:MAG: hypothetical protein WCG10_01120 [Chlamydiota bacterium]
MGIKSKKTRVVRPEVHAEALAYRLGQVNKQHVQQKLKDILVL